MTRTVIGLKGEKEPGFLLTVQEQLKLKVSEPASVTWAYSRCHPPATGDRGVTHWCLQMSPEASPSFPLRSACGSGQGPPQMALVTSGFLGPTGEAVERQGQ